MTRVSFRPVGSALALVPLLLAVAAPAQQAAAVPAQRATFAPASTQRSLNHDDYDDWMSLSGVAYSKDGKWVAYSIRPQWGDGFLEVRQTEGDAIHRHPRGTGARFSANGRYVVFSIPKSKVEERRKKIEELKKKGKVEEKKEGEEEGGEEARRRAAMMRRFGPGPRRGGRRGGGGGSEKGDLGILDLTTGKVEVIERVKGFRVPEDAAYLVYHLDKPEEKKDEKKDDAKEGEKKPETGEGEKKEGEKKPPTEKPAAAKPPTEKTPTGKPASERTGRRPGRQRSGAARQESGDKKEEDKTAKKRKDGTPLVVRDMKTGVETRFLHVASYGLTEESTWLYFHCSMKKESKDVAYGLHAVKLGSDERITLLPGQANFAGFASDEEENWLAFTSDKEDFAAEKPVSDLYLWDCTKKPARRIAYKGGPGMPRGKVVSTSGLSFSKDGSVLSFTIQNPPEGDPPPMLPDEKVVLDLWHWQDGMLQTMQAKQQRQLKNPSLSSVYHIDEGRMVVLGDERAQSAQIITPDGSRALLTDPTPYLKEVSWDTGYSDVYVVNTVDGSRTKVLEKLRGRVRPSPDGRYLVYFDTEYHWHSIDVQSLTTRDLTGGLGVAFHQEDDDHPHPARAHGVAGWTEGDAEVVLYDAFDLWKVSPATGDATCVTDGFGRVAKIELRYQRMDDEEEHLPADLMLSALDTEKMTAGFFRDWLSKVGKPRQVVMMPKRFAGLTKADESDRLFFTMQDFRNCPNLFTSKPGFQEMKQLSDANPQQRNIRWGTSEQVRWRSADGVELKGILVKPDGFDPNRKYPMMVYFYERNSRNLHRYVRPSPGTSPNAAYYVSNGYLWFIPDIYYDVGYPGPSCVKCVVSGVQHLIEQGFVDENAIGAAGHSWGGYQTAFLVTRTNIFKAVESGAPVSNMVSAYGGIRWSSGMVRQFQYEQSQSRIGGSLWQYPMRYWENSPIFFADKVKTPVLILHNDQDGAVPWYQGIEYFTALRRLGKEAYLFNYVGEAHGLRKRQNQKDWTRRMQEYFDHHLKGAPMAKWMRDGVPYHMRDQEKLPFTPSFLEASAGEKAEATPAITQQPVGGSGSGER